MPHAPQPASTRLRHLRRITPILLLSGTLLVSACSVPGRGDDDDTSASASPEATVETTQPTRPAVMPIVTPTAVTGDGSTTASSPTTGDQVEGERPATYVVQENDSLYAIALRFSVELDALIAANGLADPNDIQVGQELIIPAP